LPAASCTPPRVIGLLTGLLSALLIMAAGGISQANAASEAELSAQRKLFQAAETSLRKGALRRYNKQRNALHDYPLAGYLDYRYLRSRLNKKNIPLIEQFLLDHADSPISDHLRRRWLKKLASTQQWQKYLTYFADLNSTTLDCYRVRALIETGQINQAMKQVPALWLSGRSQPKTCDRVFSEWEKRGHLSDDLIWARIRLAMKARKLSLAKYLSGKLDKSSQQWVSMWRQVHRRPATALKQRKLNKDLPVTREIILHGLRRLARLDAAKALAIWQQKQPRYQFTAQERNEIFRKIALSAAYQRLPEAQTLLSQVAPEVVNERVSEWRIRTAVKNNDWDAILDNIEQLDETQRNEDHWRYWKARALTSLGYKQQAEQIYSQLSEKTTYYGFLSAESLTVPYKINEEEIPHTQKELKQIKQVAAIQRASELYQLGRIVSARREWNRMIKTLGERDLELAGVIAHKWGWHDRAILTVGRTKHRSDLNLRYPIAFKKQVMRHAKKQNIAPAWVYSVLRQESAYMQDARSPAGAMGLMQLMPRTARSTARSLKLSFKPRRDLLNANKNIRLGTAHLKQVYKRHNGHFVLATASYNAGSHRVKSWLPESSPLSSAAWIESMPFKETRNYVKRILTTTPIFETRLQTPVTPLSKHMLDIKPQSKK